jgi:UDP-3-O-[3-hydroxymyristoyl] glucosamine N-acyltransferase
MSSFDGKLVSQTYKQILKMAISANEGVSASLINVQTGDGVNTALQVATGAVQVAGTFGVGSDVSVSGDIQILGKVCASTYFGDGTNLTGVTATIEGNISVSNIVAGGTLNVAGTTTLTGAVMVSGGSIDIKNTGSQSNIKLYCESSNAHYAALQSPPHSSFSGNLTITLPTSSATLVGTSTTDTLTNKTFGDAVTFDDDVSVSGNTHLGGTVTVGGAAQLGSTLSVTGATHLKSTVSVGGDATFAEKVCASAFYGDGTNITGIPITGNISVSNAIIGGTLSVSGATHLKSTVSVAGNTAIGGTVSVVGAATFESDISVSGDINVGGHVTIAGAVSLGSTLDVTGNVSIGGTSNITGKAEFEGDVSVSGGLVVGGTVTISGANVQAANAKVCASAFYGDGANLTNVPAVITGNISVNNATVGGNLYVGGTTTIVSNLSVGGTASIGGAVNLLSTATVSGAAGFLTTVRVSGNTTIGGTLDVAGNTSIGGTSNITGNAEFEGDVSVSGDMNIGGHTTIAGAVQLGSTLSVTGEAHLKSAVSIGTTLVVGGKAEFDSDVCVSGNTAFVGNVSIGGTSNTTGKAEFEDDVSVSGNAVVGGTVSVGGGIIDLKNTGSQSELRMYCESSNAHYAALKAPAHSAFSGNIALVMPAVDDTLVGEAATQTLTNKTFGDKVEFDNDVCVSGNAVIVGNVSIGGTSNITGNAEFEGNVSVSGNLNIGGTATVAGNASVGGTLTVGGKAEFDGDVCVSGNSQLVGTLKVTGATTVTGNTGFLGTVRVSGNTSLEGQLQLTKSAAAVVCATAINGITSVSLNFGNAQNFSTIVTAAHTLAKPTGCRTGQTGSIFLVQSGGSGTMAYNADFKFIGGTDPTMTATDGAVDRLDYIVVSASSDGVGGDIQMVISQAYA